MKEYKHKYTGFHGTFIKNVDNIMKYGFDLPKIRKGDDHWLGHGIYFYNTEQLAVWWAETKCKAFRKKGYGDNEPAVILAEIAANEKQILNLDDPFQLNTFLAYCKSKEAEIVRSGYVLSGFKNRDGKIDDNIIRCIYLDFYKAENYIGIILYTFSKDNPSYAEYTYKYKESINLGLTYNELQICITSNDYIANKYVCYPYGEEYI